MKGLKFLIFLGILLVLILIFMLPFYYDGLTSVLSDWNEGRRTLGSIYEELKTHFKYIDSWSVLGFVFIASGIMLIHGFMEYVFLFRLNKYYSGTFVWDGLLWFFKRILSLILTTFLFILVSNLIVDFISNSRIYNDTGSLEEKQYIILLLGTNKFLSDGKNENLYYTKRIDAVWKLYQRGYVRTIYVSGDNSNEYYNEPRDMKASLVQRGVPPEIIKLDYAGFRTLDSIVRSKETFDVDEVLIVSQGFHLRRAVFLAQFNNMIAKGYAAEGNMNGEMFVRENLAVPKMLLDIWVLNSQPQFAHYNQRNELDFSQKNVIMIASVLILLTLGLLVSYDAFDFGEKKK